MATTLPPDPMEDSHEANDENRQQTSTSESTSKPDHDPPDTSHNFGPWPCDLNAPNALGEFAYDLTNCRIGTHDVAKPGKRDVTTVQGEFTLCLIEVDLDFITHTNRLGNSIRLLILTLCEREVP
jgi:hypothetical protein